MFFCKCISILFFVPRPAKFKPEPLITGIPPLGPRLARLRKLRGYTQYSLADIMGVSRKQIADYERGLAHPNDEMLTRITLTLKISADTLLGLKDIDTTETPTNTRFTRRLKELELLPEPKKKALIRIIDEFISPT